MKYLENHTKVHLMTFEPNPRKRNINNVITFNADNDISVNTGDVIFITPTSGFVSAFEVLKVIEKRDAALMGFKNYTARIKWDKRPFVEVYYSDNKLMSNITLRNKLKNLQKAS